MEARCVNRRPGEEPNVSGREPRRAGRRGQRRRVPGDLDLEYRVVGGRRRESELADRVGVDLDQPEVAVGTSRDGGGAAPPEPLVAIRGRWHRAELTGGR